MNIEPLEPRIAPAALVGGKLTYTDTDGDLVTILFSKKTGLDEGDFVFDNAFGTTGPQKLLKIDLADDAPLAGTNITMKVTKVDDGHADVGALIATGLNLGAVKILGDLRQIIAGSGEAKTFSIKSLSVLSFGVQGAAAPADLQSTLAGKFGKIAITDDFEHANLQVFDPSPTARSTSFIVGGKLIGGAGNSEGVVSLGSVALIKLGGIQGGNAADPSTTFGLGGVLQAATIGSLTITGDVQGGNFFRSGSVQIIGSAAKILIGGKLLGAHAGQSGYLTVGGAVASLTVGGLVGGNLTGPGDFVVGGRSGAIDLLNSVGILTVKDGITGGSIGSAGSIFISGDTKRVTITGNLTGSDGDGSGSVQIDGKAALVKMTGSLLGGTGNNSGVLKVSELVSGTVIGNLVGTDTTPTGPGSFFGLTGGINASKIGTLKIVGSILGGDGREEAGGVSTNQIKTFTLTGSLEGGASDDSGQLDLFQVSGAVTILGGIKGGAGEQSGLLMCRGAKSVLVGGLIEGGSNVSSGAVQVDGNIGAVIVGGLQAGTGLFSGSLINQFGNFKSVLVKGDVVGLPANPAHIAAAGGLPGVTLGSVTVNGQVAHARITAGLVGDNFISPDVSIGKVTIGKDFTASAIVAGVNPQGLFFADGDDTLIAGTDDPEITARIGSVLIKGAVLGTANSTNDSFGIVAQEVVKVTVGRQVAALIAGTDTTGVLLGGTTDVRVREIV
jgi:hypothetical protein